LELRHSLLFEREQLADCGSSLTFSIGQIMAINAIDIEKIKTGESCLSVKRVRLPVPPPRLKGERQLKPTTGRHVLAKENLCGLNF
jgi:hypothetical protein